MFAVIECCLLAFAEEPVDEIELPDNMSGPALPIMVSSLFKLLLETW